MAIRHCMAMALHGVGKVCVAHYSVFSSGCKGMAKEKHTVRAGGLVLLP